MNNSDGKEMTLTNAFIEECEKRFNIKITKFNDIRGNIYKLESNKCYLYIKESNGEKEFWGFGGDIIEKLQETNSSYFLILLSSNNNNYCFSRDIIQKLRNELKFSYTINDNKKYLEYKITLPYLKDYDEYKLDWNTLDFLESIYTMEGTIETAEELKRHMEDNISDEEYQNKKENKSKEETIKDKCQVIADIVNSLRDKYETKYLGTKQADFLETLVGAAIFYIYNLNDYTWCKDKVIVSKEALSQNQFCADHIIPRKYAASLLLKEKNLTRDKVHDYLKDIFCKVLYLTKSENASFRKKDINKGIKDIGTLFDFEELQKMYDEKEITLIPITKDEFEKLKKKQR